MNSRSKRQTKLPSKYVDTFTGQHFDHFIRTRKSTRDREKLDEDCEAEMDKFVNNNRSGRRRRGIDEMKPDNSRSSVESPVSTKVINFHVEGHKGEGGQEFILHADFCIYFY